MLVLAPAAVFLIALALAFDMPRRVGNGVARLRRMRFVPLRGDRIGAGFLP